MKHFFLTVILLLVAFAFWAELAGYGYMRGAVPQF